MSAATLSYWQSGRSHPTRSRSRELLGPLADVLDLPHTTFLSTGTPQRSPTPSGAARETLWEHPDVVTGLVARLGGPPDSALVRLRQHDRVTVGPDGRERTMWSRHVMRAARNDASRLLLIYQSESPSSPPPTVRVLRGGHPGRIVSDSGSGHTVAELLLDRPLRRGESTVTEYEWEFHPPFPVATFFEQKFRLPVREYIQEVRFHPAALPSRCFQQISDSTGGAPHHVRRLRVNAAHSVHAVTMDALPGVFGLQWTWDA
ncbi:hypothetical protein AB0M43_01880 [Longispora sp. NPDC051575]|uniref:hypothetical protein n=1 Tax=Longispora sp. NPDC051575 TaxID=3154943 RepID=UPI003439AF05